MMASQRDYDDFGAAQINQIVKATRLDVPDLDQKALLNDLINCYDRHKKIVSPGTFRRHRERFISIRKHVDRVAKLIDEDDADFGVIRKGTEGRSDELALLSRTFSAWIARIVDVQPGDAARSNRMRHGVTASALQMLTGSHLRQVYEQHFKQNASASRSNGGAGPPEGPYIRFVTAVLSCWGMDCSPETIDDALGRKI
jgi:hypothetical protein